MNKLEVEAILPYRAVFLKHICVSPKFYDVSQKNNNELHYHRHFRMKP